MPSCCVTFTNLYTVLHNFDFKFVRQYADNFISRKFFNQNLFRFESNQKYKHRSENHCSLLKSRLHFSKLFYSSDLISICFARNKFQSPRSGHTKINGSNGQEYFRPQLFDCCGTTEASSSFLSHLKLFIQFSFSAYILLLKAKQNSHH